MSQSLEAAIQAAIFEGYALAAGVVGLTFSQYRPTSAANPICARNFLTSLPAAFSVDNYAFKKPPTYGKPERQALIDGSQTQVGDCLVGARTYFIAAMDPLEPISAVECNHVVNILRPPATGRGGGLQPYGGATESTETPILTAWPASVLNGTKVERGDIGLPDDVRQPWVAVLVPAIVGTEILTDDVMTTDLGDRYKVSSAELTSRGWRLTAMLAEA